MERADDRRRYFIVGSVILEIGLPAFRKRIEDDFKSRGFGSLQDFLGSLPIMHILFHLRHTNVWCCNDKVNCKNKSKLPLKYQEWSLLFTKSNHPNHPRLCHCNYTTNSVQLKDLDITLASLILLNCCNLTHAECRAIEEIRNCKNNYLSHNTKCYITEDEFDTLWINLTTHVLQLDNSREDDLVRIQNRPLDQDLCTKYTGNLLDIHRKLEKIHSEMSMMRAKIDIQKSEMSMMRAKIDVMSRNIEFLLLKKSDKKVKAKSDLHEQEQIPQRKYTLGQDIFYFRQKIDLKSYNVNMTYITGGVVMDDGKIVLCDYDENRLVICNTDKSQAYTIPLQGRPWDVTAVNNFTVAVTLPFQKCIHIYDIDNKIKTNSILQIPELCCTITYINNKFVVGCSDILGRDGRKILIIDDQTTNAIQTIQTDSEPCPLHATDDMIYYGDFCFTNKLHCIRTSGEKVFTKVLPSIPTGITTLQDGSVYVVCDNGQVQHMSADGQNCTPVTKQELKLPRDYTSLSYNAKQRKMLTCSSKGHVTVFGEI